MKLFIGLLLIAGSFKATAEAAGGCEDKAPICVALKECHDNADSKKGGQNWGANKCDGLTGNPACKKYCAERVAKVNDGSAKACPACNKADFTPEDGDCEGFLAAQQTGKKGEKQNKMMAYCQIKAGKAKEAAQANARKEQMTKSLEGGPSMAERMAKFGGNKFKSLRGMMQMGGCNSDKALCRGKSEDEGCCYGGKSRNGGGCVQYGKCHAKECCAEVGAGATSYASDKSWAKTATAQGKGVDSINPQPKVDPCAQCKNKFKGSPYHYTGPHLENACRQECSY